MLCCCWTFVFFHAPFQGSTHLLAPAMVPAANLMTLLPAGGLLDEHCLPTGFGKEPTLLHY
jgi:hypothetical protein